MKTAKQNWFKSSLSLLLALILCIGVIPTNAFAGTGSLPEGYKEGIKLKAPAEDGVYYAEINLKNYSSIAKSFLTKSSKLSLLIAKEAFPFFTNTTAGLANLL